MKRLARRQLLTLFFILFVLFGSGTAVFAQTIVEPLPDNNLVQNPWFRSGNKPSLDGWTDAAGSNVIWSMSQKRSNPGTDEVLGTSARFAFGSGQGGGTGQSGVDAYLYQVIPADSTLNHLQFKIHWVTQWIDRATVTIYGGTSADGPWTAVWTPLDVNQATSSGGNWTQTELLDRTIPEGFPFYKMELFARYPEGRKQGAKFTGVFFSVDGNAGEVTEPMATEPPPAATATQEPAATAVPVQETATSPSSVQAVPPTSSSPPTITAEEGDVGTAVAAVNTAAAEPTSQPRPTRPAQATAISPQPDTASNQGISGIYLLIIGILLLLVIVLGIGWARSARH